VSDLISGIRQKSPVYPVKPVQPAQKYREPGKRPKKDRRKPKIDERHDDGKTTIDEHV
jgi:hypothetical protein